MFSNFRHVAPVIIGRIRSWGIFWSRKLWDLPFSNGYFCDLVTHFLTTLEVTCSSVTGVPIIPTVVIQFRSISGLILRTSTQSTEMNLPVTFVMFMLLMKRLIFQCQKPRTSTDVFYLHLNAYAIPQSSSKRLQCTRRARNFDFCHQGPIIIILLWAVIERDICILW